MQAFFIDMAQAVAGYGALRLGLLEMGTRPVAAVLCFDYNNGVYLYNSGYDPSYARLSAGLISKLEAIRWAIQQKKRVFDFLKGAEVYKERLGGMRLSLSSCRFSLT
jgi:CelD/BcsL family acetyltransferase involved in cellulose biosynthesis